MTRRTMLGILAGAVAALRPGAGGAQSAKDVKDKTAEAWEALKAYTHAKQNDAVAYGKKLMKETDDQIKQLQARASRASGDAKVEYDKQVKALKAKQAEAGKKLSAMGKATAASWDTAKQGFADAYKDLQSAYERAAAQWKS